MEALRQKYEAMLDEMRRNGNADKEFVANELRKRIQELEKQIDEMREKFSLERDNMLKGLILLIALSCLNIRLN